MNTFSTSAILLRRVDFGDYDLILRLFTPEIGKISVMAKSAKKSAKRFSGILELFSLLNVVCTRGRGLPVLEEASLKQGFIGIRSDIRKTAYASYWAELINGWTEEGENQDRLYHLLYHVLESLDVGNTPEAVLSILFQMRFMAIAGLCPNLDRCGRCGTWIDTMKTDRVLFDVVSGEAVCKTCLDARKDRISEHAEQFGPSIPVYLSKGTIKQLLWIGNGDLKRAERIRFSPQSLREGLVFAETFLPYHLGRTPRSLGVLRQVRNQL